MNSDDERLVYQLEERLGVRFRDPGLLHRVITRGSIAFRTASSRGSILTASDEYQRLEFQGDSILSFLVASWAMETRPKALAQELTELRASLTCNRTLDSIGEELGIFPFVPMAKYSKPFLRADDIEAIIGAAFQDQGIHACITIVDRLILSQVERFADYARDYRGELRIICLEHFQMRPTYTESSTGNPTSPLFSITCLLKRKPLGTGQGPNKKGAKNLAAKEALQMLVACNYSIP